MRNQENQMRRVGSGADEFEQLRGATDTISLDMVLSAVEAHELPVGDAIRALECGDREASAWSSLTSCFSSRK